MKKPLHIGVALSNNRFSRRHSETTTHTPRFKQLDLLDDRPERDIAITSDPSIFFTEEEIKEFFRELHKALEGGVEC